jgi:hypothetical protein
MFQTDNSNNCLIRQQNSFFSPLNQRDAGLPAQVKLKEKRTLNGLNHLKSDWFFKPRMDMDKKRRKSWAAWISGMGFGSWGAMATSTDREVF